MSKSNGKKSTNRKRKHTTGNKELMNLKTTDDLINVPTKEGEGEPRRRQAAINGERRRRQRSLFRPSNLKEKKHLLILCKTGTIHNTGVRAATFIKEGIRIIKYHGDVITDYEQEERAKLYKDGLSYFMKIMGTRWVLDGRGLDETKYWAHLFNHSCKPNCQTEQHYDYEVWIYSKLSISEGEEVTLDYCFTWCKRESPTFCFCRTDECRGFIESDSSRDAKEFLRNNPNFIRDFKMCMEHEDYIEKLKEFRKTLIGIRQEIDSSDECVVVDERLNTVEDIPVEEDNITNLSFNNDFDNDYSTDQQIEPICDDFDQDKSEDDDNSEQDTNDESDRNPENNDDDDYLSTCNGGVMIPSIGDTLKKLFEQRRMLNELQKPRNRKAHGIKTRTDTELYRMQQRRLILQRKVRKECNVAKIRTMNAEIIRINNQSMLNQAVRKESNIPRKITKEIEVLLPYKKALNGVFEEYCNVTRIMIDDFCKIDEQHCEFMIEILKNMKCNKPTTTSSIHGEPGGWKSYIENEEKWQQKFYKE